VNPPAILIEDIKTALAAKNYAKLCGTTPPPNNINPPTAVNPEMAFVIDIKGV
jgi:hypothetical protein